MNNFLVAVAMGTLLGILAGLGTGGGSLLILWLTLAVGMPQAQARAINLLFFLPSALIASFFRMRQGRLEIKKVLPAMIAGSISAGLFSYFSAGGDTQSLQKLFGLLLLVTGFRELLYKPE